MTLARPVSAKIVPSDSAQSMRKPSSVTDSCSARVASATCVGDVVISIAQFTEGNTPVVWRGPMLHRALQQ